MKKFITWTVTMMVAGMMWGQIELTYDDYYKSSSYPWGKLPTDADKDKVDEGNLWIKMNDPVLNLQLGAKDQLRANNYKWAAMGLNATAYGFWAIHISSFDGSTNTEVTPFNVLGTIAGVAGVGCWIGSVIHERRAVKRMYWGMNGITIPLNQQ